MLSADMSHRIVENAIAWHCAVFSLCVMPRTSIPFPPLAYYCIGNSVVRLLLLSFLPHKIHFAFTLIAHTILVSTLPYSHSLFCCSLFLPLFGFFSSVILLVLLCFWTLPPPSPPPSPFLFHSLYAFYLA